MDTTPQHTTPTSLSKLATRMLGAIANGLDEWSDETFNELALSLHQAQIEHIGPYREWASTARALQPSSWREIAALPIAAFKRFALTPAGYGPPAATYMSSGTTASSRSRHLLPDLRLYEASLLAGARAALVPDAPEAAPHTTLHLMQLQPSGTDAPWSSLSHMLDRVASELCRDHSVVATVTDADTGHFRIDTARAWTTLHDLARAGTAVLIAGPSFAFVELLEADAADVQLAAGSRAMDTGGYKGRTREYTRAEIVAAITQRLAIPATLCENEYGMCELSSQAYLGTVHAHLRGSDTPPSRWQPPWMRTRVVDPVTLEDVDDGEEGLLVHHDLANVYSCAAVRTEDIGVRCGDSWRFVGRAAGAQLKGCSLPLEALDR